MTHIPERPPVVQFDDLREGRTYTFVTRGTYPLRGVFGGFLLKKKEPMIVMLVLPGEVLSFPVSVVKRVREYRPRR